MTRDRALILAAFLLPLLLLLLAWWTDPLRAGKAVPRPPHGAPVAQGEP